MNTIFSNFLNLQRSSGLGGTGLVMMDDGGSKIGTRDGPQDRQTWIAVLIPPLQSQYAITQMDGLHDEVAEQFGAAKLHAYEIFQRQSCWAQVPIGHLKGVIACVAEIFRIMRFPIVVQTFWEGNESHHRLVKMGSDRDVGLIQKGFGIDIKSPKEAAFILCIRRFRDYIAEEFPDTKWEVFADAGKQEPGRTIVVPLRWNNSDLVRVHFEDSKICRLIQLADYVAYFLSRSQQIAHCNSASVYDEELLDILGTCWNFVNLDYEERPRQHPV